jgi:hypothetical protein
MLDILEPYEFYCMHIDGSHNVQRRVLGNTFEWDYEETILELVTARELQIVVI